MIESYMNMAINEAVRGYDDDEVPVGAIVLDKKGSVIGKGYNQVERLKDATAHAEMLAITSAMATVGKKYLEGATIVVTMEPCPMCAGAIGLAKIGRLIFGAYDTKIGASGTRYNLTASSELCGSIEVIGGIKQEACSALLRDFFIKLRSSQ